MADIGSCVAQIISDPRTLNWYVFAYTEVLSMNDKWDTTAAASGETPLKDYVSWVQAFRLARQSFHLPTDSWHRCPKHRFRKLARIVE